MRSSFIGLLLALSHIHGALSHDPKQNRDTSDDDKFKKDEYKDNKDDKDIECDVAIIGGGSAGTHAAISLKDKGKSIIVIEQKDRMGGHTETYIDPATGTPQDYGVLIWHNTSTVQKYFQRFNIPLEGFDFAGRPQVANYDLRTGKGVNIPPPDQAAIGAAFAKYAGFLAQYPELDKGMYLPDPVPADLTIPFGEFATKYGIEAAVQTIYLINAGIGNILTAPVVENARVFGLSLVQQLAANSLVTTAHHNNSELYYAAQKELLASNSLLLSSTVDSSKRKDGDIRLTVNTPQGKMKIRAKKLLITIPPRVDFLRNFDLDANECALFDKFIDAGYYVALVRNTGIPPGMIINNADQNTAFNLPSLPGTYGIGPTAIPDLYSVSYSSLRSNLTYPLPDANVKAAMIDAIKNLQKGSPEIFATTEPEIVVYTSHAPFYLQARPEDTQKGFYKQLYGLQGQRSTWWSGATWRAHDSSEIWEFNDEVVLPGVLEGI